MSGGSISRVVAAAGLIGSSSLLTACGGGTTGLIPATNVNQLSNDLSTISQEFDGGNCRAATAALAQAQSDFANLPASVNAGLRQRIADGLADLGQTLPRQCATTVSTTTHTTSTTSSSTTTTTSSPVSTSTSTSTITTSTSTTPPLTSGETTTSTSTSPVTPTGTGGGTLAPGGSSGPTGAAP